MTKKTYNIPSSMAGKVDDQFREEVAEFALQPDQNSAARARRWNDIVARANERALKKISNRMKNSREKDGSVEIPSGKTVYDVEASGSAGGAVVSMVVLSEPFPVSGFSEEGNGPARSLRAKGDAVDVYGGIVGSVNIEITSDITGEAVRHLPQVSLDIKLAKGVDYINKANSHRTRDTAVSDFAGKRHNPDLSYHLDGEAGVDARTYTQFYRMNFGD